MVIRKALLFLNQLMIHGSYKIKNDCFVHSVLVIHEKALQYHFPNPTEKHGVLFSTGGARYWHIQCMMDDEKDELILGGI